MIPKYTGEWDRGAIWRGDTLLGFSMRIADKVTDVPIIPATICAHIVDQMGRKVVALDSSIGTDGTVTFGRVDGEVTSLQSGRVFVRRNFTAVPVPFTAQWAMKTDEQAVQFEAFYRDTLKDGTLWFNMPLNLPQGRGGQLVQFQGIYSGPTRLNAPDGNGVWEYSANMMLFLRPE